MGMGSTVYKQNVQPVACGAGKKSRASLCYISDEYEGITRKPWGRGFSYFDGTGNRVRDDDRLERIKALVIPPAWTDVWISPLPEGHIQAVGRDEKGRKQYIYHPRWVAERQQYKFDRLILFGKSLTRLRQQVDADLRRRNLDRDKVSALAVALLDSSKIRIGNREYERRNRSYGLTTLKNRHVEITGATIQIEFTGKHGKRHKIDITSRRLANQVTRCQELPGQELFQYIDDQGGRHPLLSEDVNTYLQDATGKSFTAKDVRTWWGTVLMAEALIDASEDGAAGGGKRRVARAVRSVAEVLGNTTTVCRQYYIHPEMIRAFESGRLAEAFAWVDRHKPGKRTRELNPAERAVLRMLEHRDEPPSS